MERIHSEGRARRQAAATIPLVVAALLIAVMTSGVAYATFGQWGATSRVNVSASGQEADTNLDGVSVGGFGGRATADGRYVVFCTGATNLVPGDTNSRLDVFLRDRRARSTTRVSVSDDEQQSTDLSFAGDVTADGRYVYLQASGPDLLGASDTNSSDDILVRDTVGNTTQRAVLGVLSTEPNKSSYGPDVTPDGKFLAFESEATNLVSEDTNGQRDVFVRELGSGENALVSVDDAEAQANDGDGVKVAGISDDGRYVAFTSKATNLVANDTNGVADVFLRDVQAGTTIRVSVDSNETEAPTGGSASQAALSADGRYVVFTSSTALESSDTNFSSDIYLRDTVLGETRLVSKTAAGVVGNSYSYLGAVSPDGGYVAFSSAATNLVTPAPGGFGVQAHLCDLSTGEIVCASLGPSGLGADSYPEGISVGNGGSWVMFQSPATDLVSPDNNSADDLFFREYGDFAKPITTSDVKSTYYDKAVIKLTATDTGGSGVAFTKYKIDSNPWQTGTTVAIPSLGAHTLRYYSVDKEGNAENAWQKQLFVWGTTHLSLTKPSTVPTYNSSVKLSARLTNKAGAALPNKTVVFEYWSGSTWVRSGSAVTNSSGYAYHYATGLTMARTYRARFAGASPYVASEYASVSLLPRARLMRSTSWSTLSVNKLYYAKGYIEPRHAVGDTNKVRIRAYKKGSDGKYRYVRSFTAAYGSSYKTTSGYKTAYRAAVKLTSKGTWKLVGYHAADARNATAAGAADYLTAK